MAPADHERALLPKETNPLKPSTHNVQQLFEQAVRYTVPLYQRPYVWDEEHQWAPLWDDVMTLLDRQASDGLSSTWTHFLGALVLEQEKTMPGEIPQFIVIDGQQRLTTLQLLLAATADALAEVGAADDSALLRELILNNPKKAKGVDRFKVWPTNANRSAFQLVMEPSAAPTLAAAAGLIPAAYKYFRSQALAFLMDSDEENETERDEDVIDGILAGGDDFESRGERSQILRITMCELLKVVSITLEPDDNAQVIFETLNARGTPLLALDLVKNAVFSLVVRQVVEAIVDDLYSEVWQPELEQEYWRDEVRQGRLFRPRGELFLMHWLTMKLERTISATELFPTFRTAVLSNDTDAGALIRELCDDAAVMRSFDNQPTGSFEDVFFRRFRPLDAGTFFPVVLLLFRSAQITVDPAAPRSPYP